MPLQSIRNLGFELLDYHLKSLKGRKISSKETVEILFAEQNLSFETSRGRLPVRCNNYTQ